MRVLFVALLQLMVCICVAQPEGKCRYTARSGISQNLPYTESKTIIDSTVYKTVYYVFDNNKLPFKAVTVANNTEQQNIAITINELKSGTQEKIYVAAYNRFSGLILSEEGDSMIQLSKPYDYLYLLSFTGPEKTYLQLHYISSLDEYSLLISTITDSVLSANREYLKQSAYYKQFLTEQQRKEAERIAREKEIDSLVNLKLNNILSQDKKTERLPSEPEQKNHPKSDTVTQSGIQDMIFQSAQEYIERYKKDSLGVLRIREIILERLSRLAYNPSDNKYSIDNDGNIFYGGNAQAREGDGILVKDNQLIYSGVFSKGQFVSGQVYLRYKKGNAYTGNFANAQPKGLGKWDYPSGEMELGIFDGNVLQNGVVRRVDSLGNSYRGNIEGERRNGFGVFTTKTGNVYLGIFESDVLKHGYISQTDDFALKSYFTVTNGEKKPISEKEWMDSTRILSFF
ncbi:MAG: hypothetical protein KIS94_02295 [Chitinophagales bacterium]|nr:hypothetical protein [Chitinophagales bacterium]